MRDKDGHIYCFVSFARGPCLSQEAMEQIFAIYYALSIAPNAERVIRTHDLVPEYDEKMEKLTVLRHYETLDIIESMISETNLESIRDANGVQEIPADVPSDHKLSSRRRKQGGTSRATWGSLSRTRVQLFCFAKPL